MLELVSELDTPHSCYRAFAHAAPAAWIVLSPDDTPIPSHFPLNITSSARPPLDTLPKVINPMPPTFSNSFSYFAFHSYASLSNTQLITKLSPSSLTLFTHEAEIFVCFVHCHSLSIYRNGWELQDGELGDDSGELYKGVRAKEETTNAHPFPRSPALTLLTSPVWNTGLGFIEGNGMFPSLHRRESSLKHDVQLIETH